MTKTLHKEVVLPHAMADVWAALTDSRALAEWLMPNDFEPVVGKRFRFQVDPMGSFSGINECEVLEVVPPRRLVYSWRSVSIDPSRAAPPMRLTWQLLPHPAGTRLVLDQEGLEVLSFWWRLSMKMGWRRMLQTLLPRVLRNVHRGAFTPGAITKRDYRATTVPNHFAK